MFRQYLSYTATTQVYVEREHAPFPDVSICNLEPNLDDVTAVREYITKLDDIITKYDENINVINQVQGLKNKFAMFQNIDDVPIGSIDRHFIAECIWTTVTKQYLNCTDYVSRLVYTGNFGQCFTFSTLLMKDLKASYGIYNMKILLYLDQFQSGNSHLSKNNFHHVDHMNGCGEHTDLLFFPIHFIAYW